MSLVSQPVADELHTQVEIGLVQSAPDHVEHPDAEPQLKAGAHEPGRLLRNIAALFGAQLVTWTMTLLWTLVVPRLIGPAQMGVVQTAISITGMFGVLTGLASSGYLVREMVMSPNDSEQLLATSLVIKLLLAPLIIGGGVAFVLLAHYGHEQRVAVYFAAVLSVGGLIIDAQTGAFQSREQMHYPALGTVVNKSGQSVLGIGAAVLGLGALGIVANMALITLVVVFLQFLWLRRLMRISLKTNLRRVLKMAKRSSTFLASGLFFTFYLWIDSVLLSLMTNARTVGWYAVSTTLVTTFMFLPSVLVTSWLPRFVSAARESQRSLFATARAPVELLVVLSAPIAGGVIMGAHLAIKLLYGPGFGPAAPVIIALAFCIPPTYFNMMMVQVYIASGRQVVSMWLMAGAAIVNPLMNLALIPWATARYHNGAVGAAIALDLTELLIAAASIVIFGRQILDRPALKRAALATCATVWMWAVASGLRPLGESVGLAAGGLIFGLLAYVFRIPTDSEIQFMRRALARVGQRFLPSSVQHRRAASQEAN